MSNFHNTVVLIAGEGVAHPDPSAAASDTIAAAAEGELVILDQTMSPADTSGGGTFDIKSAPEFYVVQKRADGGNVWSQKIQGAQITKYAKFNGAAAAAQVSYVGYNTNAGTITPVVNSSEYILSIIFTEDKVQGSERQLVRRFNYTSDASATAQEIADGLVALINADEVASTKLTAATTNAGANYGISLTAKTLAYKAIDGYSRPIFEIALDGAFDSSTPLDEFEFGVAAPQSVTGSDGVGTNELVKDMERAALYTQGISNLMKHPVPSVPSSVDSTTGYDLFVIEFADKHASANLNKDIASPLRLIIATPAVDPTVGHPANDFIQQLLDEYMLSIPIGITGSQIA